MKESSILVEGEKKVSRLGEGGVSSERVVGRLQETKVLEDFVREKKAVGERIGALRQRIDFSPAKIERTEDRRRGLMGQFMGAELDLEGRIIPPPHLLPVLTKKVAEHKSKFLLSPPSLFVGTKTATEYDSKVGNFSTRTAIITLDGGQKVFAVYNYPSSWAHRALDGAMKRMAGDRMSKASSQNWKETFERRSNIPVIVNEDPNMVLMPYVPNMNAYDVFANTRDIQDFGACPWARDLNLTGKVDLAEQIMSELGRVHAGGKTWGETILPNVIITADKRPVIVDPETEYSKDVPLKEQKARDVRDLLLSLSGALHKAEQVLDYQPIVQRLLSRYPDGAVVIELKRLVAEKPTFLQRVIRSTYEVARLGISTEEYQKVCQAILAF